MMTETTSQARRQKGPYTLDDARIRVEHLLRAGIASARVSDLRALCAPDDRDGSEDSIKGCYATYDAADRTRAAAIFAAKPWLR